MRYDDGMLLALSILAASQVTPIVALDKEISDATVKPLIAVFQEAAKNHTPAITLLIQSPGGMNDAGYALIRTMLEAEAGGTKVTCVVQEADSMAALVVEGACTKRVMHRNGKLLFHESGYVMLVPTREEERLTKTRLRKLADELEPEDRRSAELVAAHMHMTPDEYLKWIAGQDREVDAPTALARGWIDEIID